MELPRLFRSAVELEEHWKASDYRFCFIGGIAVQRWGEPRSTQDLDLTLMTGFGGEGRYLDELLKEYSPRIEKAREFALRNRVLLVRDRHGVPLDIALAAMPFEDRTITRASEFHIGGIGSITTCSATDLIVHKAFADRDRDWLDMRGILIRSGNQVDWSTVLEELTPLVELKEEPGILKRLEKLKKTAAEHP